MKQAKVRRAQVSQSHQYKSSPDYMRQQNETPKRKRNTEVSLPKLETGVTTQSNLKQPITREQLLLFLDQIRLAVDNVQQIVCSNDHQIIQQSQPIRSSKKFKISQEQQTEKSYIQQLLRNKNQYVNKVNKKTQTPIKELRSQSQQDRQILKVSVNKLKTEQNEESDVTEKKGSRFPNISQSAQKSRVQKVLPQYKTNRVQSQILQNSGANNEIYYNEETNKQVSSNDTQQLSSNSNLTSEEIKITKQSSKQDSTQKKKQQIHSKEDQQKQMVETNKNAIKIIDKNLQTQQNSIKQLSSQRYSSEEFEETEQIIISKSSNQGTPIEIQQIAVTEEKSNLTPTPVQKKRPIHVKNLNPSENSNIQSSEDLVVKREPIAVAQQDDNTSQQQLKQQQQTNMNDEEYEYSNEFLSEHSKEQDQVQQVIEQKESKQSVKQSQRSSKIVLEINPQAEFYPEKSLQQTHNQDDQKQLEEDKLYQAQKKSSLIVQKQTIQEEENNEGKKILQQSIQIRTPNNTQENAATDLNEEVENKQEDFQQAVDKQEIDIENKNENEKIVQTQINNDEQKNDSQKSIQQEPLNKTLCQSSLTVQSLYVSKSEIPYRYSNNEEKRQIELNQSIQKSQQANESRAITIKNEKSSRTNEDQNVVTEKEDKDKVIENPIQISKNEDLGKSEIIGNQSVQKVMEQADPQQKNESIQSKGKTITNNQQSQVLKDKTVINENHETQEINQSQFVDQNDQQPLAPPVYKSQQLFHVRQNDSEEIFKSQIIGKKITQDNNFLKFLDQKKMETQQHQQIQNQQQINSNDQNQLQDSQIRKRSKVQSLHQSQLKNSQQIEKQASLIISQRKISTNEQPELLQQSQPEEPQKSQKKILSNNASQHLNPLTLNQDKQTEEIVQNKDQIEQSIAVSLKQEQVDGLSQEAANLKQK